MLAGHAGLALAARARYREVPLGTLMAAAFALDLAWPILVLLGLEERPGARWPDLGRVRGSLAARDLDGVLPVWAGVAVLSADRRGGRGSSAEVLASVWAALVEGHSSPGGGFAL